MRANRWIPLLVIAFALASCSTWQSGVDETLSRSRPPAAPREFRAMWIATVANIDWPSRRGLPVAQQIDEMRRIVQTAKRLHFNALILQVRPSADALYASTLEPWTEYLSSVQGRAPEPFYDPLSMWITMAHESGLELHAWFNPYRARHTSARSPVAATHVSVTHPRVVKSYGDQQWMDPGESDAARRTLDVIRDVVRRYDVDGVHIDDYFYPYPVKAEAAAETSVSAALSNEFRAEVEFPDDASWRAYQQSGGKLLRADWRRDNVNRLVAAIYRAVHQDKPWVKFGISPFGLGRPDQRPPGIEGFSQYDKLYVDVELWLREGWLDYLAPQLYWRMDQTAQAFPVLLRYWASANTRSRHLWPGLFTSRVNDTEASWTADEIVNQVGETRSVIGVGGQIHFSAVALVENRKLIGDLLASGRYVSAALVPETPWLRGDRQSKPMPPVLARSKTGITINGAESTEEILLDMVDRDDVSVFAVWAGYGAAWRFSVEPASTKKFTLPRVRPDGQLSRVMVAAVDRYGTEGSMSSLGLD